MSTTDLMSIPLPIDVPEYHEGRTIGIDPNIYWFLTEDSKPERQTEHRWVYGEPSPDKIPEFHPKDITEVYFLKNADESYNDRRSYIVGKTDTLYFLYEAIPDDYSGGIWGYNAQAIVRYARSWESLFRFGLDEELRNEVRRTLEANAGPDAP